MKSFECRMCGRCCYGEGGIVVEEEEIERISRFLGVQRQIFVLQFCEERGGSTQIRTGWDNYCIFFDQEKMCLIHPVKPWRCALWPFYSAIVSDRENWEQAKEACPGINSICSFEDFVQHSKAFLTDH